MDHARGHPRSKTSMKHMKPLTDLSPMPFGIHKDTPMQDVPASYLHYLWINGMNKNRVAPVAEYIRKNLSALKQEYPNGIWT